MSPLGHDLMPRRNQLPAVSILIVCLALACHESAPTDESGTHARTAATLALQAGDSQFATVGRPVPVNPAVLVTDESGMPVQGVAVTFALTSGGGSASGTTAVSDSAGFAAVGSWTLGPALGKNTMTATVSGNVDPVVFSAIALCDCWESRASLSRPRFKGGSADIDGRLYVVGGQDATGVQLPLEVYDPSSDTWSSRGSLPLMYDGTVAALGGRLYLMAGQPTATPAPWLQSYDPQADQWTARAAPPTARFQFRIAAVNGRLYALGGQAWAHGLLRTVEAYDPATDTWSTKASMLHGRVWMAVAVVNGILYAMGGESVDTIQGVPTWHVVSTVEAYDPATNAWTAKASLPAPITASAAAVVNGIIYVTGGVTVCVTACGELSMAGSANVFAYDPSTDKWSVQPLMHAARSDATASAVDGTLYVIGGIRARTQEFLATVEAYRP
jgi:N-acetylneuraminic acid mutarotase